MTPLESPQHVAIHHGQTLREARLLVLPELLVGWRQYASDHCVHFTLVHDSVIVHGAVAVGSLPNSPRGMTLPIVAHLPTRRGRGMPLRSTFACCIHIAPDVFELEQNYDDCNGNRCCDCEPYRASAFAAVSAALSDCRRRGDHGGMVVAEE